MRGLRWIELLANTQSALCTGLPSSLRSVILVTRNACAPIMQRAPDLSGTYILESCCLYCLPPRKRDEIPIYHFKTVGNVWSDRRNHCRALAAYRHHLVRRYAHLNPSHLHDEIEKVAAFGKAVGQQAPKTELETWNSVTGEPVGEEPFVEKSAEFRFQR